jgi:hypothetical protein
VTTVTEERPAETPETITPEGEPDTGGRTAGAGFEPKATAEPVSTEVATRPSIENGALVGASINARIRYARELANANLLPSQYRKNPANVLYAVEYGLMLGIHPMAAITGIHVIDGKPSASAALMSALVRTAGHRLRVSTKGTIEGGDFTATAMLTRSDDPDFTFETTWTVDRAMRAGLVDKYDKNADGKWVVRARTQNNKPGNWETYPEAMAKARCISEVIREGAEEVLCGAHYTAEELGAMVNEDGNVIDGEVVESLSAPAADDRPQPMHPARTEHLRAQVFACFTADDPKSAFTAIWQEAGPQRKVTPVLDEKGVQTDFETFMLRAMEAIKNGVAFPDERPDPKAEQAAQPKADPQAQTEQAATESPTEQETANRTDAPQPDADGIVDAEVVEETTTAAEPAAEQGDGFEPPDAPAAALDDPPVSEPATAPGAPQDAAQAREWLLGEIGVVARVHGKTVAALTARQASSYKRNVADWSAAEMLGFVEPFRASTAEKLREAGQEAAAMLYGGFGPAHVLDVATMLSDALDAAFPPKGAKAK